MLSEAKHLGLEREMRAGYAGGVLRGGQILRFAQDDRVRAGDWQAWLTLPNEI